MDAALAGALGRRPHHPGRDTLQRRGEDPAMSALFSIFGFLTVILHGFDLIAQSVLLGSIIFLLLLALPLAPFLGRDGAIVLASSRRVIQISAIAGILIML